MADIAAEEEGYLETVEAALAGEAERLSGRVQGRQKDQEEFTRYLWERKSDFDGYEEIFMRQELERAAQAGESAVLQLRRIIKMMDSPYFARIDFTEKARKEPEPIYIGKYAFWNSDADCTIYDWRSPIAGMYYEFEYGPASYEAPEGEIFGRIGLKRQYGIRKGRLEYAIESSLRIEDELLKKELARSRGGKMRDIVATIQKEQNQLVRNEKSDVLIIEGVAGSGKTSIALHRIAYFLYRYRKEISADNFLILSPNGVFIDYISEVLPELGERNIRNVELNDLGAAYLPRHVKAQDPSLQTERFLSGKDEAWKRRVLFKAAPEFVDSMDRYLEECDRRNFRKKKYVYEEGFLPAEFIYRLYEVRKNLPVYERMREMAEILSQELRIQRRYTGPGSRKNEIEKWLLEQYRHNTALALYQDFYRWLGKEELLKAKDNGEIEAADIFPLLYVRLYLEGSPKKEDIRYLIVDEMQDYTPIQYAVLNKLFPCKKTMLGDFSQNLVPFAPQSSGFMKRLYPNAQMVSIRKSYRSTYEIMQFAGKLKKTVPMEVVERHGEEPALIACAHREEERDRVLKLLRESAAGGEDAPRLGLLTKDQEQAKEWYAYLKKHLGSKVSLLSADQKEFYEGITAAPISLVKGLEFDEVVVPDVCREQYISEYHRSLLYVACTRATQKLTLLWTGEKSPLLPC